MSNREMIDQLLDLISLINDDNRDDNVNHYIFSNLETLSLNKKVFDDK